MPALQSQLDRRRFLASTAASATTLLAMNDGFAATPVPPRPATTRSGGRKRFFRLQKVGDKWVLLDPEDKPFFMRGLNHYGDGSLMPLNLKEKYGTAEAWRRSIRDRHREWGFNYLPPSVGPSESKADVVKPIPDERGKIRWPTEIRRTPEWPSQHFADLEFPFTGFLDIPRQYMAGRGLPDVFSQEFRDLVDKRCREFVAPLKDNPHLIGYHFSHNPPWDSTNTSFHLWIHDITAKPDGRRAWSRLMRRIYGTVDRWRETYGIPIDSFDQVDKLPFPLRGYVNDAKAMSDKIAFMQRVCDEWFKVFTETIRKYDENHLILGDRNTIHLHPLPEYAINVMRRYIDVLSVNAMGPMRMQLTGLEQVTRVWDGPIHLADTGAGIYNGEYPKSAYMCRDLDEFDELYQSYMDSGLTHPQLIGFGWCGYYETPSSRSGLVDSRNDQPLADRVVIMRKWNRWMDERFGTVSTSAVER